ncbi:MAG TPA: 50S ribosomal protein L23 [Candidatus Saccharimonadales bacterium]|jgi:ribosomal protein L23
MLELRPRLSEKTYQLAQSQNTYVFDVPLGANRQMVSEAVAGQFKVSVLSVNVRRQPGKVKRSARRRMQPVAGQENETKRAYVKLKGGDKIPLFEEA